MADYNSQSYGIALDASDPLLALSTEGSDRFIAAGLTFYRMQGWDTVSLSWVTWTSKHVPDPSAAQYPGGGVSVSNAFILNRWEV